MGLNRFRRLIFWTFIIGFFITVLLVLFNAFGYRYSFTRGIFVYSGSITLKTIPQDVTISVDGQVISKQHLGLLNNSIHITGFTPGEHFVEVSAPNYTSWTKKVLVGSGVSTEFWNVVLTETRYASETLPDTTGVMKIFPDTQGKLLAFVKEKNNETSLVLYDRNAKSEKQIYASTRLHFDPLDDKAVEWSADSGRLILQLFDGNTQAYTFLTLATSKTIPLSDIFVARHFGEVRFEGDSRSNVLFLADANLYRVNLDEEKTPELLAENVLAYDLSGNYIYIARLGDGTVLRLRQGSNGNTLTQITATGVPSLDPATPAALVVYDEDRLILLEKTGKKRLSIYNRGTKDNYGFQNIGSGITDVQFSNDGKKLLFYSQNELSVYFIRDWLVQPERTENSVNQLARFSDPVKNVNWTEDYEHVLFVSGTTVKMIELDNRDRRVISDIFTLPHVPTQVLPVFADNHLFFVSPEDDVTSIIFPIVQPFFGQ